MIEDDQAVADVVCDWLEREGHTVDHVNNGTEGLELLTHYEYELVILDLGLPDMSGLDVCRRFRDARSSIPILVLT